MPGFDGTIPVNGTEGDADPIRLNFNQLAVHHAGTTAPASPAQGFVWLDTSSTANHKLKIYTGSTWLTLFEHAGTAPDATALPHAATHQNGGADEVSVAGLTGLLGTDQNPVAHAADHQNGGADEVSVAGLTGLLGTDQNPVAHASDHEDGGSDEVSIEALATAGGAGTVPVSQGDGSVAMELVGGGGDDVLTFTMQNNGAVLNTGVQEAAYLEVPFDCEITACRVFGGPTGSVEVDLWSDTYANYPPTVADSIVSAAPPTISGGVKSEDAVLTGWSKTLVAGSGILANINSVSAMTWAKVVLQVTKS